MAYYPSLPSWRRGFDSLLPLETLAILLRFFCFKPSNLIFGNSTLRVLPHGHSPYGASRGQSAGLGLFCYWIRPCCYSAEFKYVFVAHVGQVLCCHGTSPAGTTVDKDRLFFVFQFIWHFIWRSQFFYWNDNCIGNVAGREFLPGADIKNNDVVLRVHYWFCFFLRNFPEVHVFPLCKK